MGASWWLLALASKRAHREPVCSGCKCLYWTMYNQPSRRCAQWTLQCPWRGGVGRGFMRRMPNTTARKQIWSIAKPDSEARQRSQIFADNSNSNGNSNGNIGSERSIKLLPSVQ
ncbi:uncharacterized protein BJ171DRAFT_171853 [Polychytrium aggregatum]|uniref:uncharacterized protein n=1 Tax=Polychytrium aggregatum TaxID=110093 RepID=UPI0022FEF990|nr:uncharacterized protein BJ171DRAFT_171853 [Polychytrium aggregatum]KAI9208944.1 hypothetical protein BJ171DRAFT_171853 [Polychytrium aggregatum]